VQGQDVTSALVALGFNLNEGRAYAALLRLGPSTGYEVSQRANIPRSAVYGVLRRLVAEGAARSVAGNPERFMAAPSEALLTLLRKRFDASTDAFQSAIRDIDVSAPEPDAFSVKGHDRVLEEAGRVVGTAQRTLVVSGWPRELLELVVELAAANARGVYTVVFSHAAIPPDVAGVRFSYGLTEGSLEAFWSHRLVIVADDRLTLVGATEGSARDTAVISETPAIAELAAGHVALDITLLTQRHGHDIGGVMSKMLGDRVGSLDHLLTEHSSPELGMLKTAPKTVGRKTTSKKKPPKTTARTAQSA